MVEFVDCSSLSISYDARGVVSASLGVLRDDSASISWNLYTSPYWGNRSFDLVIMSAIQKPIVGGGWFEWGLQLQGTT